MTAHCVLTHTCHIQKRTHIHIHAEAPSVAFTKERAHSTRSTVAASSTEPGGPCVMQQHSSRARKTQKHTGMGFYGLGETRQAAIWALLCESFPVRLPPRCEGRNHSRNISRCQYPGWTDGGISCPARCVTCSVRGVQRKKSQG